MAGRSGRKASRIVPCAAPPSLSSQATTPVPIANRLDLLLSEQTALCKNAHEGLLQSLVVLQKASSKEQDSARLQVQSLMIRAEELVMTLQVIVEIRRELAHVQRGFLEAKREQRETGKLQSRLQWLEQRLEKTLLARRRGRPAARRRRNTTGQVLVAYRTDQFQEATGSHPKPARPRPAKPTTHMRDRKAATVHHPAIVTTTISGVLESPSRPNARLQFPASQSTVGQFTGTQYAKFRPDSTELATSQAQHRSESPYSSRTCKDSDAWHSESEANWTTVDAHSNALKDTSQLLSSGDDDQKPNQTVLTHQPLQVEAVTVPKEQLLSIGAESVGSSDVTECSSVMLASSYSFEPPRPVEVFGPCSWNSLCLAMNTNQLQRGNTRKASSPAYSELDAAMLRAGLDSIYSNLEALGQLIITAARVATETGLSLPSGKLACGQGPVTSAAVNVTPTQRKKLESAGDPFPLKMPVLDDDVSSPGPAPALPPLRKIYGEKALSHYYPRPSRTWYQHTSESTHTLGYEDTEQVKISECELEGSLAMRSSLTRKKKSGREKLYLGDVFNRAGHQSVHLKRLLKDVDSPLVQVRRDSVQALGALTGSSTTTVEEKLHTKMLYDTDPTVRYESLKSLLHLGVVDALVLKFSACCLTEGSLELQLDLLQFLCQKNSLAQAESGSAWIKLSEVLLGLLTSGDSQISLLASVILSQKQLEKEHCVTKLKAALDHPDPQYQSMALVHLVNCWQYSADEIVHCAIEQMCKLYNWQLRMAAIKALERIGSEVLFNKIRRPNIFDILLDRLMNEPMQVVRSSIGNLLSELGLDRKIQSILMGRLESSDEVTRAEATIALGAFEVKSHKSLQMLLDCLQLDPSTFVRVQVIRLLGQMKSYDPVVVHNLQAKCKGHGIIARESQSALQKLAKHLHQEE